MSVRTAIRPTPAARARAERWPRRALRAAPCSRRRRAGTTTYVALLFGINLGSRRGSRRPICEPCSRGLVEEDVATYVQSGTSSCNPPTEPSKLSRAIDAVSAATSVSARPSSCRRERQPTEVLGGNPFAKARRRRQRSTSRSWPRERARAKVSKLDPKQYQRDEFRVVGQQVTLTARTVTAVEAHERLSREAARRRSDDQELEVPSTKLGERTSS